MSWIVNLGTGAPASILAQNMLYANGVPDIVGPFNPKAGRVEWKSGATDGNYFGYAYTKVRDPQCASLATNLQTFCTLTAVANSSGDIVLENPRPGTQGNLGRMTTSLPGVWSLDTAVSKAFRFTESKRLQFRVDALNLFNHPYAAAPDLNINSAVPFGDIATKAGNRQFLAQVRLEF